jgi:hypothetical protein
VNFLTAVYPSGQMDLPSRKAVESPTTFPEKEKIFNIPVVRCPFSFTKLPLPMTKK